MSFTIKLTEKQINIIINNFEEQKLPLTNNYTLFRAKINTSFVSIFKTGNLLIQGGNERQAYINICELIGIDHNIIDNPYVDANVISELKNSIGTDEVGTGDFFGSIVVCGCYVPTDKINSLLKIGVKDSKELSDIKIVSIAKKLLETITYAHYVLDPVHYNYLTIKKNLNMNEIKAILHNHVISALKKKTDEYELIVVDAFCSEENYYKYLKNEKKVNKDIKLVEKAENKYLSVACASILARYFFLEDLKKLSNEVGFELPKGAGKNVDAVIANILMDKDISLFKNISKMNFNNLSKLLN